MTARALEPGGRRDFLDQIGELSAAVQATLLRVLRERAYQGRGGTATLKTDVARLGVVVRVRQPQGPRSTSSEGSDPLESR